ncbi:MAG: beta-lactamase family protein [Erysipelotrichaceae bacterium]|nr:beta-lactamase family protein [Erysipelotrichaceae bacterium]MBQ1482792.1 beta-lactamase family protein [Erysipelotrichaceae bacterium]
MVLDEGKKIIKQYVDEGLLPGAVFACVTKDGCEKDFYGYKALLPEKEVLTLDTVYDLASLSKVVSTAPLILKLIEEGRISIETKVSSVLEDFPFEDITVKDLMSHTSGIAADDKNYKKCKNGEELWDFMMKEVEWPCRRKERVIYSCFGFIILGKIIEHYKKDIPSYFDEVIAGPLGAVNMFYRPEDRGRQKDCAPTEVTEARGIIQGEVHDGKAHILEGRAGNAGVFSDLDGLVRFTQMILNDGVYEGKKILERSSVALLKEPYTEGMNETRTIGGWFYGDRSQSCGSQISERSLYHTGFTGTSLYIDLERGCGIVLLANAIHPSREHKMAEIRRLFHDEVLRKIDELKKQE